MQQVRAAGDRGHGRTSDKILERLRVGRRDQPVLLPPDDVGWQIDAMQPAIELGIAQARRPRELRRRGAVAVVDLLELRRSAPSLEPVGSTMSGEQELEQV